MNYVVGDVHGEISKLKILISSIITIDNSPRFIFIGDYIDKGEDANATLAYLVSLSQSYNCVFLIGNHEYCWMNFASYKEYLLKYGGLNTAKSFGCNTIEDANKIMFEMYGNFFGKLVPYFKYNNYLMTHSGVAPEFFSVSSLEDLKTSDFLFNRYDFIKNNVLFQQKYKMIFGHTGFFMPFVNEFKIGIDTGACYLEEQPITAFNLDNEMFFDSNLKTYSLKSINGDFCPNIMRNKPWRIYD